MCKDICKKIHNNKQDKEKEKEDYNDFSEGFFDYLNDNKPTTYNKEKDDIKNIKNYIEGYTKAMMIKKECDGEKINTDIKGNININQNITSTH